MGYDWNGEKPRIFIVDDVASNRAILEDIIEDMGCEAFSAENGIRALERMEQVRPHLILSDISMPEMNGYEFCRILKNDPTTRDIPVIFISAFQDTENIMEGFAAGSADYVTKPFIPAVIEARIGVHLKLYESSRNQLETNRKLQSMIEEQVKQLEQEKKSLLTVLNDAVKQNADYNESNMKRLQRNCRVLAQAMQFSPVFEQFISDAYVERLELAVPLCNLGYFAVPDEILMKKQGRTEKEECLFRNHTQAGAALLKAFTTRGDYNDNMQLAIELAQSHHERWDGTGYPNGLAGKEIPLSAQIAAVMIAWNGLTPANPTDTEKSEAMEQMLADAGTRFNPDILSVCRKIIRQLR